MAEDTVYYGATPRRAEECNNNNNNNEMQLKHLYTSAPDNESKKVKA